ncbi:hypothetical protein ABZ471_17275 [Streptomyces sp. NPDC005728]|uniref:hypothetical protein n=1 Tax=Streptomyces sp. NPDC005728 TaxID=3157054 RepID=UPI003411BD76
MTTDHRTSADDPATQSPRTRKRPRLAMIAALAAAVAGLTLAAGTPASATQNVTIGSSSVSVRDCYHPGKQPYPSTSCTYKTTLEAGLAVRLVCQYAGQNISGDSYWDYVLYPATSNHGSGEGYVSDWYVNTGVTSAPYRDYNVPLCSY